MIPRKFSAPLQILSTLILLATSSLPPPAFGEEDEADAPANVQVKTKRSSIGSRSLPRLTELTEAHAPKIARAKLNLAKIQLDQLDARVAFFPRLDASSTLGVSDVFAPDYGSPYFGAPYTSPYNSVFKMTLTENLYDNGQSFIKLDKQKTALKRARLEFEYVRDEQLRDMASSYLDWSASSQLREIDENKRDLLRRQFNVLDAQYKQGLKTKRDVLRIETEMRRLEMSILERDNEVDLNFQKLSAPWSASRVEELGAEDIEGEEPRPYVATDPGLTVEIKAAQHRRKQSSWICASAELEFDVKLGASQLLAQRERHRNGNADYVDAMYLWPIPDNPQKAGWDYNGHADVVVQPLGFRHPSPRHRSERKVLADDQTTRPTRQELFDLGNVLRDNWNKLRQYREQVKMSRELLSLEQQSYSILEAEYRSGRASYLDLITNLNTLIDARSKFITAYFGLRKSQIVYAFHRGDLYDNVR